MRSQVPSILCSLFKLNQHSFQRYSTREKFIHSHLHSMNRPTQETVPLSLQSYLKSIYLDIQSNYDLIHDRHYLHNDQDAHRLKLNAVTGNQAGDADSIISSIALAYLFQLEHANECTNISRFSFPIISIPRKDFKLRRDVSLLLKLCGIQSFQELLYTDDILRDHPSAPWITSLFREDGHSTSSNISLQLTLVDHNKVEPVLWHLRDSVTQIWDHHRDEGFHNQAHVRKIAFDSTSMTALVGSTCSLIVEEIQRVFRDNVALGMIDPSVALALLGVIILDTMNMSKEAGKGTQRDQTAIDYLLHNTPWDYFTSRADDTLKSYYEKVFPVTMSSTVTSVRPDTTALYEILRDCKFDPDFWREMPPEDALRIDYKKFGMPQDLFTFGLSSVLLSCYELQQKKGFPLSTAEFLEHQKIDVLGILSLVVDESPKREIGLVGKEEVVRSLTRYLRESSDASFLCVGEATEDQVLTLDTDGSPLIMIVLQQGNSKASRKQIAPIIQHFASKY